MVKTTVYLDPEAYRRLKQLAARRQQPPAALIRAAVAEFARRHATAPRPRSLGRFRSGRPDVGTESERYLKGFGEA